MVDEELKSNALNLEDLFDEEEESEVVDASGDSFDPENTPDPETQSEDGEEAKDILKQEYQEEHTEPQGEDGSAAKKVKEKKLLNSSLQNSL